MEEELPRPDARTVEPLLRTHPTGEVTGRARES